MKDEIDLNYIRLKKLNLNETNRSTACLNIRMNQLQQKYQSE